MLSKDQVGKAIIRLRKIRGLSQEKFAFESDIDRRYLSDVENGKRNISLELLNRVSRYFNISLSYFIGLAEQAVLFESIEELRDYLLEHGFEGSAYFTNPDYLDAILGISHDGCLVYSYERMVDSLILKDNMSFEDAIEFIDYNTVKAIPHMGKHSPIIVYDISK